MRSARKMVIDVRTPARDFENSANKPQNKKAKFEEMKETRESKEGNVEKKLWIFISMNYQY